MPLTRWKVIEPLKKALGRRPGRRPPPVSGALFKGFCILGAHVKRERQSKVGTANPVLASDVRNS